MKNIVFVLLILLIGSCKNEKAFISAKHVPSKIDSLITENEIQDYIRALDTNLRHFYLADYSRIITYNTPNNDSITRIYAKQLGVNKSIYKTDFNNDGLTDLLLIGGWDNGEPKKNQFYQFNSQVLINRGKGKPDTYSIARDYNFAFVPQIVQTDSLPILVLHHAQNFDTVYPPRHDTLQVKLINKLGLFVEYNKNPITHHEIEKIEFNAPLVEVSPSFQMILNKNRESWFIAVHNNLDINEGTFKTEINDSDFKELSDLLNYMDFRNLREDYGIYNTGPPNMALRITYDKGKIKYIYINSGAQTYGLNAIYRKMLELRFSQEWKRTKEPKNIRMPEPERRTKWKA